MYTPGYDEINHYKDYDVIPVSREIYADIITPITLLRKIADKYKNFYLLESIEGGEKWARYSFFGFDPKARLYCKDGTVTIEGEGANVIKTENPLQVLREYISHYKTPTFRENPPFTGGLVGYYGYSMIGYAEPTLKLKSSEFNDFDVMLCDKIIAYDHLKQKITVIVNMKTTDMKAQYEKAVRDIEEIVNMINDPTPPSKLSAYSNVSFQSNFSEEEYANTVEKTKEYIFNGDIFQAVISRRFETPYEGSLLNAYRVLRVTNPSPYMVFMKIGDNEIISTSPETLVRYQNGRLTTFPIAGSRPRGKTEEEDLALEKDLLQDEKELSEHNMLVDLGRNDLGKISRFNSVEVTEYMQILRYSKIMHICSEVQSDARDDVDAFDAIESVLPAGTLSGAPKVRACEIIEELEKCPRGIYGGAIGYVDFNGNMDTCIAIRMASKIKDKVYVQAGGGIVADSIPHNEYMESYNKALAVMNAIKNAGEVDK